MEKKKNRHLEIVESIFGKHNRLVRSDELSAQELLAYRGRQA